MDVRENVSRRVVSKDCYRVVSDVVVVLSWILVEVDLRDVVMRVMLMRLASGI